jgi:hypothetical protein
VLIILHEGYQGEGNFKRAVYRAIARPFAMLGETLGYLCYEYGRYVSYRDI